jgi:hypothetical protein
MLAMPAAGAQPSAVAPLPAVLDGVVIDRRLHPDLSRMPGLPEATPLLTVHGDLTALWLEQLDAATRARSLLLAGLTLAPARECLEHLVADRGMARSMCVERDDAGWRYHGPRTALGAVARALALTPAFAQAAGACIRAAQDAAGPLVHERLPGAAQVQAGTTVWLLSPRRRRAVAWQDADDKEHA